jgi:hypothetical protein
MISIFKKTPKNGVKSPYGRRSSVACCGVLQYTRNDIMRADDFRVITVFLKKREE